MAAPGRLDPSGNAAVPADAVPVVGDFAAPGQASIFWYRLGSGSESLFVSPER